jgi:hypothetical protein
LAPVRLSAVFRFVAAQHPPMSAVANRQDANPEKAALIPLFEKYRATAGFFGHDHNYQHYVKDGIHYVITGGGGAPLYDVSMPPKDIMIKAISVENFVTVSVNGNIAKVETKAIDGSILDAFETERSGTLTVQLRGGTVCLLDLRLFAAALVPATPGLRIPGRNYSPNSRIVLEPPSSIAVI